MVAAFFPEVLDIQERRFQLTQSARGVRAAIFSRRVVAFAPEVLLPEFVTAAARKSSPRLGGSAIPLEQVHAQILAFRGMPLTYVPMEEMADTAWELIANHAVSPPDSWYLACALQNEAELWVSHAHRDGFLESSRRVHAKVFALTETPFDRPK